MNQFQAAIRKLKADLNAIGVPWALVGGLAVSARGAGRFTNDIDVVVVVGDERGSVEVVNRLRPRGYVLGATVEDELTGRQRTARLLFPTRHGEELWVDLLFGSTGIEPEIAAAATPAEILRGLTVPVAATGHLIAMKILSEREGREQDPADIDRLLEEANESDIQRARVALDLITQRGFARGKDLLATFERYLSRRQPPP